MGLRRFLDDIEPGFSKGGRFEKFEALYEMIDTLLYTPSYVTRGAPHLRDAIDLKRVMTFVLLASMPPALIGIWNVGFQANSAMLELGVASAEGWRGTVLEALGIGYDPGSVLSCFAHGLLFWLPIYVVTIAVGGFWEVLFAVVRNHEVNEGFLVTSWLFVLILPPTIPLWQVAMGISFAIVIGKEVFGGTGKNFLNPALVGRAFLYFAYPAQNSGDSVWVPVDGYSNATPMARAAEGGAANIDVTQFEAFVGIIEGTIGAESVLGCLIGAVFLLSTRVASWRIMLGCLIGFTSMVWLLNAIGSDTNQTMNLSWTWHFVIGGFAFGAVYMATDPVSGAMTSTGKLIFGILVGVMTVFIRAFNVAFPEGIMLAILFANVFAPLIDYCVVQANVRRRIRRHA